MLLPRTEINPIAKIDLQALQHNAKQARQYAPQQKLLAVIKSDAYGHCVIETAKALVSHVDGFAVARTDEGIALRENDIKNDILVMGGFESEAEFVAIANNNLAVVIHDPVQLTLMKGYQGDALIKVWLKLETGMHRLGIMANDIESVWLQLKQHKNIHQDMVIMSHFAKSEELNDPMTQQQIEKFEKLVQPYETEQSLANSAAIISWPQSHKDWLRAGALLYGLSPFPDRTAESLGLKPVMTLTTHLKTIRHIKQGASVGYGATWTAAKNMKVGVIAVGYGDGYPRMIGKDAYVLLRGKPAPILGRVSMDMCTIDLSQHPAAKVGDEVVLWGNGLPVEIVAKSVNTDPRELVTGLTSRVVRQFKQ